MVLGNYYGQPPQRRKRDRARFNFMLDRYLYDRVKEDAKQRNMTMAAWIEQAIANQLHAMSDLPAIEMVLESKLLEILMRRDAFRAQNNAVKSHEY